MNVLHAGGGVVILRFLPDGRRLLAGVTSPGPGPEQDTVAFVVLPLAGGGPVGLDLPPLRRDAWVYQASYGNAVAVHPDGDRVYVAWDANLYACRTADGARLPVVGGIKAHHVAVSADGGRLVAATSGHPTIGKRMYDLPADPAGVTSLWERKLPSTFYHLVGLMADGRLVVIDDGVRIRAVESDDDLASAKYPSRLAHYPALSPDGRTLGVAGYSSFYLYDLPGLGKPRTLGAGRASADVRGFAFHPDGKTFAIILGAPTLVKLYDLETMKLRAKLNWKLGPLGAVAFSPDGTLGAAGSEDGRIVVWDVD